MPSPPKKTKKSLETPAFSPILTDFSVRLLYFCPVYAMFLPCPPLFILPFCSISLFLFVFSLFLRSFWLFFSFLALFFTFYGICALCTRFFGGCCSIGFLSAFWVFYRHCCLLCFPSPLKNPPLRPFFRFLFLFLCLYGRLLHRFLAFFMRLSEFAEEKLKNALFLFIRQRKNARTAQTVASEGKKRRRRKARNGGVGRQKPPAKGKIDTRAGNISQKQAFFSLIT